MRAFLPWMLALSTLALVVATDGANAAPPPRDASSAAEASAGTTASGRALTEEWLVPPVETLTVGGRMGLVSASGPLDSVLGVDELEATDLMLLRLDSTYGWGGRVQLFGSATLMPKQPPQLQEPVWQGATLGALVSFAGRSDDVAPPPAHNQGYRSRPRRDEGGKPLLGLQISTDVGPLLYDSGYWAKGLLSGRYRQAIHDNLVLRGLVGAQATALLLDNYVDDPPRFGEVLVSGGFVLRERGVAAFYLGTEFYFPFVTSVGGTGDDLGTEYPLEPKTRANVRLGAVLAFVDNWDLYTEIAILDRGEVDQIGTTLPIIDGGFDQSQITVGLQHRFTWDDDENASE